MSYLIPEDEVAGVLEKQSGPEGTPLLPLPTATAPAPLLHDTRLRERVDTRLHEAARAQDVAALRALLAAGAAPAALDWAGRTPLHVCVVERLIEPLKVLLSVPGSADVCDGDGAPLLNVALLHGWQDGARAVLDAGASVATNASKLEQTPMDIAIDNNDMDMLDRILTAAERDGVLDCLNKDGNTALVTAIKASNLPAIQALLKRGASPKLVSNKNETALHVAVHDPNILKYFLNNTDVTSSPSDFGEYPLHEAVREKNPESVKLLLDKFNDARVKTEVIECNPLHYAAFFPDNEVAKLILEKDLEAIHEVDNSGDTPLHTAVHSNNRDLAALIMRKGGNLSTKDGEGQTVLKLISSNFYDSSSYLDSVFDEFICNEKKDGIVIGSCVDYRLLSNGKDMSQMDMLEEFVRCDQSKLLIHPLIESLLYLKWRHFLPLFYAIIGVYAIFLASFNVLIFNLFCFEDLNNSTIFIDSNSTFNASTSIGGEATESGGFHGEVYWVLIGLIYISIFIMLLQESFFIYLRRSRYFASVESWVKLSGLLLSAAVPLAASAQGPWPRHVACAALLLAWLQAMFLISRGPRCGYYVLMFGKVAVNILKIFVTAIFLVIGFSFCFMIQYRAAPPFNGPFAALVKTLFMMSTEFDYENLSGKEHDEQLQDTRTFVHLLFVMFVIFVAIVLMNFMIGVAVSDMSDLNETGNIGRLKKQIELLNSLDKLAYDSVFSKWFKKTFCDRRCHKKMYFSRSNRITWDVWTQDESEYCIHIRSSTLQNAILDTANKNDQQAEKLNMDKTHRFKIDSLYDSIVDKPVNNDKEGRRSKHKEEDSQGGIRLREMIAKQNEQIKSLVVDITKMSHEFENIKRSNNDLNLKIDRLSSDILTSLRKMSASINK